jgi:hypothetical protein
MSSKLLGRISSWIVAGGLVVLLTRSLVYALVPSPLAQSLQRQAGGPRLPIVSLISLAIALGGSSTILWLASLGVRERRLLERRPIVREPRLRLTSVLMRTVGLFAATSVAFALLESYLHWRAGLGWHGLHCLVGPVHRDALPILTSLSVLAAAVSAAVEHVFAWMRRTIVRLRGERLRLACAAFTPRRPGYQPTRTSAPPGRLGARAPPLAIS